MWRSPDQLTSSSLSSVATEAAAAASQDHSLTQTQAFNHQQHSLRDDIKKDQFISTAAGPIVKGTSYPDIGILGKDFKRKGETNTKISSPADADVDVDVGILKKNIRQQHDGEHLQQRFLQMSVQLIGYGAYMCPAHNGSDGRLGSDGTSHINNLFYKPVGYFPKCSCPSPDTCGPELCECLELDGDGDILKCMSSFNQLCKGTMYINGIKGPWSMGECLGSNIRALYYCSMIPCSIDGGSISECYREFNDAYNSLPSFSQGFYVSEDDMISSFNDCSFNSGGDKSIVQCYCESFRYGLCVNKGTRWEDFPDYCESMNCCFEQTDDSGRLNCLNRFSRDSTGDGFYRSRDTIQEGCIASGKSSDQCKCEIQGLSNCLHGIGTDYAFVRVRNCDLLQCCESQTDDVGMKDCHLREDAQLIYNECISRGNSIELCYFLKSETLCSSGYSDKRHCDLYSYCRDNASLEECISNFTASQPSSTPSMESPSNTGPAYTSTTSTVRSLWKPCCLFCSHA